MAPKARAQATANGVRSGPACNAAPSPPIGSRTSAANPWLRRKQDDQIAQLAGMGFSAKDARAALEKHVWNLDEALDWLLTNGPFHDDTNSTLELSEACDAVRSTETDPVTLRVPLEELPTETGSSRASEGSMTPVKPEHDWQEFAVSETALEGADRATESAAVANTVKEPCKRVMPSSQVSREDRDSNDSKVLGVSEGSCDVSSVDAVHVGLDGDAPTMTSQVANEEKIAEKLVPALKRIDRVASDWGGELGGVASQEFHVKEGDFVLAWTDTVTEHGWIYAEDYRPTQAAATSGRPGGWMPTFALESLPEEQRWMRCKASTPATHESQIDMEQDSIYKVHAGTQTSEGWVYVEAIEGAGDMPATGWAPVFCLHWTE